MRSGFRWVNFSSLWAADRQNTENGGSERSREVPETCVHIDADACSWRKQLDSMGADENLGRSKIEI